MVRRESNRRTRIGPLVAPRKNGRGEWKQKQCHKRKKSDADSKKLFRRTKFPEKDYQPDSVCDRKNNNGRFCKNSKYRKQVRTEKKKNKRDRKTIENRLIVAKDLSLDAVSEFFPICRVHTHIIARDFSGGKKNESGQVDFPMIHSRSRILTIHLTFWLGENL